MEAGFTAGFLATMVILAGLSIYMGIKHRGSAENSRTCKAAVVSGTIIGTLVGGSSTIGTAQLAYHFGMSAWWFTLGGGIGCLLMGVFFVSPMRRQGCDTLTGMISARNGQNAGSLAAVLSSAGTYINLMAQLLSATSILSLFMPGADPAAELIAAALLMILYALSGGIDGIGSVGILKTLLLYVASIGAGMYALYMFGGISNIVNDPVLDKGAYFSLFARGISTDLGAGASLILGIVSTQTYAQACLAGRTDRAARCGALVSAVLVPPIGIGGILVGLYMRVNFPDLPDAKYAFTYFITQYLPPALGGIITAALLIAVIGTGSGLALGVATTIRRDLLDKKTALSRHVQKLFSIRRIIILLLLSAALISAGEAGGIILDFSFMSMALRGAVLFVPLMCVLFIKKPVSSRYMLAAIIAGPAVVFAGNFFIESFDPLFAGVGVSAIMAAIGLCKK